MTEAGRKQRKLFYILIHVGFFWCCIESTWALTYHDKQLSCLVCTVILPPGGEAGAECFVFWRHFHLLSFKSMCCCETGAVRGGSLAAAGEELPFSAKYSRWGLQGQDPPCSQTSFAPNVQRGGGLSSTQMYRDLLMYLGHNFTSTPIIPVCLVLF